MYDYSSDKLEMNNKAEQYAYARHNDEADHLAVLVMIVLVELW